MLGAPEFADKPGCRTMVGSSVAIIFALFCRTFTAGITGLQPPHIESCNDGNVISRQTIPSHDQLIQVKSLNNILWRLTGAEHASGSLSRRLRNDNWTRISQSERLSWGTGQTRVRRKCYCTKRATTRPNAVKELAGLVKSWYTSRLGGHVFPGSKTMAE